jgi:hypothetical protein
MAGARLACAPAEKHALQQKQLQTPTQIIYCA